MENGFDLLEEKVRKAAELVKRLRKENKALGESAEEARGRIREMEKLVAGLDRERAQASGGRDTDLEREVKALRQQRDEIRQRIARLVEVLESLDDEAEER
jgi:chromosome segregation ATPase